MSVSIRRSTVPSASVYRISTQMSSVLGSGENMSHPCHSPSKRNGRVTMPSITAFGGKRTAGMAQLKAASA